MDINQMALLISILAGLSAVAATIISARRTQRQDDKNEATEETSMKHSIEQTRQDLKNQERSHCNDMVEINNNIKKNKKKIKKNTDHIKSLDNKVNALHNRLDKIDGEHKTNKHTGD